MLMKDALLGVSLSSELQKEWVVLGPHDRLSGLWTIKKKLALISLDLTHDKGTTPPGQDRCLGAKLDIKSYEFLFHFAPLKFPFHCLLGFTFSD